MTLYAIRIESKYNWFQSKFNWVILNWILIQLQRNEMQINVTNIENLLVVFLIYGYDVGKSSFESPQIQKYTIPFKVDFKPKFVLVAWNNVYFSQYYIIDKPHQMWSNMKFANLMWQSVLFIVETQDYFLPQTKAHMKYFLCMSSFMIT